MVVESNKEDGMVFGMVIDQPPVLTVGSSGGQTARLGAYFLFVPGTMRLWNCMKEAAGQGAPGDLAASGSGTVAAPG